MILVSFSYVLSLYAENIQGAMFSGCELTTTFNSPKCYCESCAQLGLLNYRHGRNPICL